MYREGPGVGQCPVSSDGVVGEEGGVGVILAGSVWEGEGEKEGERRRSRE